MKNKDTAALEVMSELKNYNKFVQTLMKKHIRKGSVLDFGCGFGDFAKHLNDSGYKCDGVELDKEANLESQKKGVKTFYFLNEIKKLCKSENIELVLLNTPLNKFYKTLVPKKFKNEFFSIINIINIL